MNRLETYKQEIIELCIKHKVKSLYTFGSVLTGDFNTKSKIDLVVEFLNIPVVDYANNYFKFQFSLQDILKIPIDLLEDKTIKNPFFREAINNHRQLIYGQLHKDLDIMIF